MAAVLDDRSILRRLCVQSETASRFGSRSSPNPRINSSRSRSATTLLQVHVDRHSSTRGANLVFGCLNIDSMNNKIDDLLDVRREQQIDVLFLTETWHDSDSVSIHHLRADGFQVIERARPRHLGANQPRRRRRCGSTRCTTDAARTGN